MNVNLRGAVTPSLRYQIATWTTCLFVVTWVCNVISTHGHDEAVITVATQKGGAGKTLLCQALACVLAADMQVVAIDADPTGALSRWAAKAYEGASFETVAEADETRLAHLIAAKAEIADLVLEDTAGFGNRAATVAMTSADAVLVPSLVGEADITEAERTVQLVSALARAARREMPTRVVMNRVKRTTLAKHAAAELVTAGLPRLTASLSNLVAYGELTYSGSLAAKGPAAAEVGELIQALRIFPNIQVSQRRIFDQSSAMLTSAPDLTRLRIAASRPWRMTLPTRLVVPLTMQSHA